MANSLADKMRLKMIALGAAGGGSLADLERQYYSTVSGKSAQNSIDDHRRAFYLISAIDPRQSVNDLEQRYWAFINAGNIVGSNADRGMIFYV
jgi:hypothetical protein